ncbi:MAG: winged helix-turn-helix transcriptional regulator [Methylophaga sp.]|nr:winged helix-turn-helix transcriptional regulator [Methylophaga sp.]
MTIQYKNSLDRTFHALGDESRRKILAMISHKQRCTAGELVDIFNVSQPTISKHLKVLETAGLIVRHVKGRHHFFNLDIKGLKEADIWINRHLTFWENNLDRLGLFLDDETKETK